MSGPNNPFAAALHAQPQGSAQRDEAGGYEINDFAAQRQAATSSPAPHNPFAASNAPASPNMTRQQAFPQPSFGGVPASASASSTNPFQSTMPQSGAGFASPARTQAPAHDSIADDLAGLDFNSDGAAPQKSATAAPDSSFAGYLAGPAGGFSPQGATSPSPDQTDYRQQAQDSAPFASAQPQAPAADEARTFAPPTSPPPASAAPARYAPPAGPPPDLLDDSNATFSQQNQSQRPQFDQMAADEEYARKLWAAENERSQRRAARHGDSRQPRRPDAYSSNSHSRRDHERAAETPPAPRPKDPNAEKEWSTKEIYWQGRSQRIIVQNENGPCSLIALCNVLLMRGTLEITPPDRPVVSYSYLSSLLGEHLLDAISSSNDSALGLEAALGILPQTQEGLDVNVRFDAIDGFAVDERVSSELPSTNPFAGASSSKLPETAPGKTTASTGKDKQRGELALFKLCNVPLVHGWLADKSDRETWAAVVDRAGDYDSALDRIVAGDDLAKGQVVERVDAGPSGSSADGDLSMSHLSPAQKEVVHDAFLISRFLESTATQLTYPGLLALSTTLERGGLYALFRNSHLSVIYRPHEAELEQALGDDGTQSHNQPQLYQLVTDSALENEDTIVWESLEDVDGSASRFYDGKFRMAQVQGDVVGRQSEGQPGMPNEDADLAYAQQLQWQEQERAQRYAQRRRQQQPYQGRYGRQPGDTGDTVSGQGNLISRMLANRKKSRKSGAGTATSRQFDNDVAQGMGGARYRQQYPQPPSGNGTPTREGNLVDAGDASGTGAAPGEEIEQPSGKSKWWKKIL